VICVILINRHSPTLQVLVQVLVSVSEWNLSSPLERSLSERPKRPRLISRPALFRPQLFAQLLSTASLNSPIPFLSGRPKLYHSGLFHLSIGLQRGDELRRTSAKVAHCSGEANPSALVEKTLVEEKQCGPKWTAEGQSGAQLHD